MIGWLIYFNENALNNEEYIKLHIEEGFKLNMKFKLILIEDIDFGVKDNKLFFSIKGQEVNKADFPDFITMRAIYPLLSKHLEKMGLKVFNSSFVSTICNDKAKTYDYLAHTGINIVDSYFYLNHELETKLKNVKAPVVVKAVDGHGGSQVFLYEKQNDTELIKRGIGKSDFVIQPITGNKNQDLRVYVIGKKIIAAILRTAKEGFKSNYSLGGEVKLYSLSKDEIKIVNRIIDEFSFDYVGIDFIIGDKGELIFNEIEDVVGSRMLYQSSNINIVKLYLEYINKFIIEKVKQY